MKTLREVLLQKKPYLFPVMIGKIILMYTIDYKVNELASIFLKKHIIIIIMKNGKVSLNQYG